MRIKNIKRLVKIIAILVCIIFVCTALTTSLVATNTEHIAHCHIENCSVCALIQNAIHFTKNINYIIEYIVLLNVAIPLCYILICRELKKPQTPLVELKVRLDE